MPSSWKDKEPQGSLSHDMAGLHKELIVIAKGITMFMIFAFSLGYITKFL
jgi:hypothetical protein